MQDAIIGALRTYFATHDSDIDIAYLFGSTARGTARTDSDIDVAVLPGASARGPLAALRLELEGDIERTLGRPVQLVVLDRVPADLAHRVLRDGVLLYERDRGRRIAFEVRARNEYFDLQPFYARYRRQAS